jgi:hypothetical protein
MRWVKCGAVALLARRDETAAGKTGTLTRNAMWQQDAYRMIQRRAADASIKTRKSATTPSAPPASPHI